MTDQRVQAEQESVPLHRRLLDRIRRRLHKVVDVNALLLNKYKLTKPERAEMFARGFTYSQFAIPIGSAIYFFLFQLQNLTRYPKKNQTYLNLYLGDGYDRLVVHLENHFSATLSGVGGLLAMAITYAVIRRFVRPTRWFVWVAVVAVAVFAGVIIGLQIAAHLGLHVHWFPGQSAPAWYVIARHRGRRVMIGFVATLLIGGFMIGLKVRKRATAEHMIISVPLAFIAAMTVAGVCIAFFAWHPVAAGLNKVGVNTGIPVIGDEISKGAIQSYAIGALAGIAAKLVLARTFYTLQLMSIERNVAQGDVISGWKRFLYGATYCKRFSMIKERVEAKTYTVRPGNKWIGITATLVAPVLFVLFMVGVWLNYIPGSPAYGVH